MIGVIETIKERCKRCYTCVRECPAKAIKIIDGQASVIPERCIGCGNCYRVCTQNAKKIVSAIESVQRMLDSDTPVAAIIAPSFPAEFTEYDTEKLVAAIKKLGFDRVQEVAFGADLVSRAMRDLQVTTDNNICYVGTSCPAAYRYVEKYIPDLVPNLAPIVSPMTATARVIQKHWPGTRVVFIGPCLSKKLEAADPDLDHEVDEALLFFELREMFENAGIQPEKLEPVDFDEPKGFLGSVFPIPRGSLRSAHLDDDPVTCRIIEVNGRHSFPEALRALSCGAIDADFLEILACEGCIMGPGMTSAAETFVRRSKISEYAQKSLHTTDMRSWQKTLDLYGDIDLTRKFSPVDSRMMVPPESELRLILSKMGKPSVKDELNCGACGYHTCREHAIAVYHGIAESEMCLPHTIEELQLTLSQLEISHDSIRDIQEQLVHSEKLASMGQLAAGIAHEVNNPLGTVLLFSNIVLDELPEDSSLREDLLMITKEAERCKRIISNLLDFARQRKVISEKADIEELIENTLSGMTIPDGIEIVREFGDIGLLEVDKSQIKQVFTNLIKNALEAMPDGGKLILRSFELDEFRIRLEFEDTGAGIEEAVIGKVFNPFFTTKPLGKGTGLGLSVSYGIIKMHRGNIGVSSPPGKGANFYIELFRTLKTETSPLGGQLWRK